MEAVASGRLQKTFEAELLQTLSHFGSSRGQRFPVDCRVRVKINYQAVWFVDGRIARTP